MTADSATNHALAIAEQRQRLVRADKRRFALPHEPEPGYQRRRARAQNAALGFAIVVLAAVYLAIN